MRERRQPLVNVDVLAGQLGWRFYVSGAVSAEGWRPTRRWADRAAQRITQETLGALKATPEERSSTSDAA